MDFAGSTEILNSVGYPHGLSWGVIRNCSGWRCAAAITIMAAARAFLPSLSIT